MSSPRNGIVCVVLLHALSVAAKPACTKSQLIVGDACVDVPNDSKTWVTFFEPLCEKDVLEACRRLGTLLSNPAFAALATPDPERAAKIFRHACDKGNAECCGNLGWQLIEGKGVAKDEREGLRLVQVSCDHGGAAACSTLAALYDHGRLVERDIDRAFALFQKACAGNDVSGCYYVGLAYAGGRGVTKDSAHAVELWKSACDQGFGKACTALARAQTSDEMRSELAPEPIIELFRRGCTGGDPLGCTLLGEWYLLGPKHDDKRAVALFEAACHDTQQRACRDLGGAYKLGRGVKRDPSRAKELFRDACNAGDTESCHQLE